MEAKVQSWFYSTNQTCSRLKSLILNNVHVRPDATNMPPALPTLAALALWFLGICGSLCLVHPSPDVCIT